MVAYVKFLDFTDQLVAGVHNFDANTYKVALTNTAPVNTQTSLDTGTNHPPPAAANGYSAGGATVASITTVEAAGTVTVDAADTVFTASGGSIGPFRYAILYNDSATSPADALVMYADYGSNITVLDTGTFTVRWNASGIFTVT